MIPLPLVVNVNPLSALTPIKFTYKYNSEEKLSEKTNLFTEGFSYHEHELLNNFKDVALSKNTCIVLTDIKPLETVFEQKPETFFIGVIAGCVHLKARNGLYFTTKKDQVYIGGTGKKLFLNIIPISRNIVELKSGEEDAYLQIDESYPYTIRLSNEVLAQGDEYRRRFEVDYGNNQITFKVQTQQGSRFLAYSLTDRVVRATGVELNETIINQYRLNVELISKDSMLYNFKPINDEIKYFNDLTAVKDRRAVTLKQMKQRDTNYLVSCPTTEMAKLSEVVVNIALSKTNFSSLGTYEIES